LSKKYARGNRDHTFSKFLNPPQQISSVKGNYTLSTASPYTYLVTPGTGTHRQISGADGRADFYTSEIVLSREYSAYGAELPGYSYTASAYRYGFNGKERDPEGESMGGGGSTYDYGFRIYNPAIAKFLSVDPLTASYPWYTPYQFAGNKPIESIDLDGAEERHYLRTYQNGKPELEYLGEEEIVDYVNQGYRPSSSLYNDAPVPIVERKVNQRTCVVVHDMERKPVDKNGGLDGVEWVLFDIRTYYPTLLDAYENTNGEVSWSDITAMRFTQYQAAVKVENAACPAFGLDCLGRRSVNRIYRAQGKGVHLKLDGKNNVNYDPKGGFGGFTYVFVSDYSATLRYAKEKGKREIIGFDVYSDYLDVITRRKHDQNRGIDSFTASDAHLDGGARIGIHKDKMQGLMKWTLKGSGIRIDLMK
jgi:RHS repeat-associated protein